MNILKIILPSIITFMIGVLITPSVTSMMYKYRMWKRSTREENDVAMSAMFLSVHNKDAEKKTPRVGGIIIWLSVLTTILVFAILPSIFPGSVFDGINIISKSQTAIILIAFIVGAVIGLANEVLQMEISPVNFYKHGFSRSTFFGMLAIVGLVLGYWFYAKLGIITLSIPLVGVVTLGVWFIPFFLVVLLGMFSSGVIDGIDGLAGGVFAIVYATFGIIALLHGQFDIAGLCLAISGGTVAFLWFNVPPARFYMGETGILALTLALTCIMFLTNTVFHIFIVGLPLVITSLSSFLQIMSKKFRGKKIFLVAPIHHHFQALGWKNERVVMRYWIITFMLGLVSILIEIVMKG